MAILYPDATIISEYRMQAGLSIRHFGIGAEHPFSYVSHGRHHWWLLHLFPPDWFPPARGCFLCPPKPFPAHKEHNFLTQRSVALLVPSRFSSTPLSVVAARRKNCISLTPRNTTISLHKMDNGKYKKSQKYSSVALSIL